MISITEFRRLPRFERQFRKLDPRLQQAALEALDCLMKNPTAGSLRLHRLEGYRNPHIYKINVLNNNSWQISFQLDGTCATLRRIARHVEMDATP